VNPPQGRFKHVTALGLSFDRCPKAWLRDDAGPEVTDALEDWARAGRGALPLAGGYLDQPARFVEASRLIDAEVEVCQRVAESIKAQTGGL